MEDITQKFLERLKELVALGKKKKSILEIQEINDFFRDMDLSTEQMERVFEYLEANNYNPKHIVVELNEQILPKSEYFTTTIADGDVMEVLSFMGGG